MTINPVAPSFRELRPMQRETLIADLLELRALCFAGEAGFRAVSARVGEHPNLASLLAQYADERAAFGRRLTTLLEEMGEDSPPRASLVGDLHRHLIDARAVLEHAAPTSMIAECERGEYGVLRHYEAVLAKPISADVENILLDQVSAIRTARAGLDRMRHSW